MCVRRVRLVPMCCLLWLTHGTVTLPPRALQWAARGQPVSPASLPVPTCSTCRICESPPRFSRMMTSIGSGMVGSGQPEIT